jgi:hypothetical protein
MSNSDEQKMISLVHCPECKGYHKINIKLTTYGSGPPPPPLPAEFRNKLFSASINRPATSKSFIPSEGDWLHLSEDQFHRRFPEYFRGN